MKLLLTFLISFLGLISLSCDSTKKTAETITETELSGTYRILQILGTDYIETELFMELDSAKNSFNARMPCNSVFAEFHLKDNSVQFKSVGATKMYCEGNMQPEKQLIAALSETGFIRKERGVLLFYSEKGNDVLMRAISIKEEDEN